MKSKFLLLAFMILLNTNSAVANKVEFLLQSAADPNKVELITKNSSQNILYLNSKCEVCIKNAILFSKQTKKNFIIVVGTKPIENLFDYLKKNNVPKDLWSIFYFDPKLSLTTKLNILNYRSVFISQRQGVQKINVNLNLEARIPTEDQLDIWN